MRNKDVSKIYQHIIPNLYKLGYVIYPEDLMIEQLLVDSFNLVLLKHKDFWVGLKTSSDKKSFQKHKRVMFEQVSEELIRLGMSRYHKMILPQSCKSDPFFELSLSVRVTLYGKYRLGLSTEKLMELTGLSKYELVNQLHNGRYSIRKSYAPSIFQGEV